MLSEAIRFEVRGTLRRAGDDHPARHDRYRHDRTRAEIRANEYAPLVQQYAERFARYRQRRPRPGGSPARRTWSTVAACRCASRSGCAQNGCSPGLALPAGQARPVAIQVVTPAPHQTPHRDARRSQPTAAAGGSGRSIRRSLRLKSTAPSDCATPQPPSRHEERHPRTSRPVGLRWLTGPVGLLPARVCRTGQNEVVPVPVELEVAVPA